MTTTSSLRRFTRSDAAKTLVQTSTDNASSSSASTSSRIAMASSDAIRAVPTNFSIDVLPIEREDERILSPDMDRNSWTGGSSEPEWQFNRNSGGGIQH